MTAGCYRRSLRLPHGHALITLRAPAPVAAGAAVSGCALGPAHVESDLELSDLRDLTTVVACCRQLLDLDADPVAVFDALGDDAVLGVGGPP